MPNSYDFYGNAGRQATQAASSAMGSLIWSIIALVLAIVGGIALYFTVFSKKNDGKYTGIMAKLYDLVQFKYFVIEIWI